MIQMPAATIVIPRDMAATTSTTAENAGNSIELLGAAPTVEAVNAWLLDLGWNRSVIGTSVEGRDLAAYSYEYRYHYDDFSSCSSSYDDNHDPAQEKLERNDGAATAQHQQNTTTPEGVAATTTTTVLFMSLTHANEPVGLTSLLATVDLLSSSSTTTSSKKDAGSSSDDPARAVRIVAIPFVNVDAYARNVEAGFGDRRTNLGNCSGGGGGGGNPLPLRGAVVGVDLNRNFANDWYDDDSSSTTPLRYGSQSPPQRQAGGQGSREKYECGGCHRPFSEPETRAVRRAVKNFSVTHAMSFHSMRNELRPRLLIHPFTTDRPMTEMPAGRSRRYRSWSRTMNEGNSYATGTAKEAIGYTAVGSSIDWMDSLGIYAFVLEAVPPCRGHWCTDDIRGVGDEGRLNARTALRFVQLASGAECAAPVSVFRHDDGSLRILPLIAAWAGLAVAYFAGRKLKGRKKSYVVAANPVAAETELQSLAGGRPEESLFKRV